MRVYLLISVMILSGCCAADDSAQARQGLYSASAHERNEAALTLARCLGPEAEASVPRLIQLLYDPNTGIQSSAAYALRRIDTPSARAALEHASKKK